MLRLKEIIPKKYCFSCNVCCRFLNKDAGLAPLFLPREISPKIKPYLDKKGRVKLKPCHDMHICPFFNPEKNICSIYSRRPFDCQLYPFSIMFDEKREKVILGIDKKCPFATNPENENLIKNYFHYLVELLEKKESAHLISKNPLFISNFQEDVIQFSRLDTLTKLIINSPIKNGFRQISLKDKPVFDRFFRKIHNPDSSQNFINLFIWKDKNPVWHKENGNNLEVLLETDSGYIDFNSLKKFPDYIYLTEALAALKGNRYKHKRASCNYFSKHYKSQYLPYKQNMKKKCLKLFSKWASERKKKFEAVEKISNIVIARERSDRSNLKKQDCFAPSGLAMTKERFSQHSQFQDLYYHKLLEDSFSAHKLAIENYKALGLTGRVIKIRGKIRAYTFGFELRPPPSPSPTRCKNFHRVGGGGNFYKQNIFCILSEVCDLKFKGISEFIFREFSKEMSRYKYINTMDDSGLENLRISKLSYRPIPTTLHSDNVKT